MICVRPFIFVALMMAEAACTHSTSTPTARHPTVVLLPDGGSEVRVLVEIARRDPERVRGLMFRDRLEAGWGMLFLFENEQAHSFWMRNTYIPLDMIFISTARRVVGIVENAQPLTDEPRQIDQPSQFVLEVPGGWAAAHRIGPGTQIKFIDID